MKSAAALVVNKLNVTMVFPMAHFLVPLFTSKIARHYEEFYQSKGVKIIKRTALASFDFNFDGKVMAVNLRYGSKLPVDMIVVVGIRPNTSLFKNQLTMEKGGIIQDMNTEGKIEATCQKKEEGNALFKVGKYVRASNRHEKATKYIEYDISFNKEEKKQSKALKICCKLNNVARKLKLKDYKQAAKLCTQVLELESTNVKALYWRAQAYMD